MWNPIVARKEITYRPDCQLSFGRECVEMLTVSLSTFHDAAMFCDFMNKFSLVLAKCAFAFVCKVTYQGLIAGQNVPREVMPIRDFQSRWHPF